MQQALVDELVAMFRDLSPEGRDKALGAVTRVYTEESAAVRVVQLRAPGVPLRVVGKGRECSS